MVALCLSLRKVFLWLIPVPDSKPVSQTFCQYNSSNGFCTFSSFCRFLPLSIINSTRRSTCLVLICRPAVLIGSTSSLLSKLLCVRFLAPIFLISRQGQQICILHGSPNFQALIFHKRLFYTLSNVLAYAQNFSIGRNHLYVYEDVVKQVETIFEIEFAFASHLLRAIKKDKFWERAS